MSGHSCVASNLRSYPHIQKENNNMLTVMTFDRQGNIAIVSDRGGGISLSPQEARQLADFLIERQSQINEIIANRKANEVLFQEETE
jgi:hypothetical protein